MPVTAVEIKSRSSLSGGLTFGEVGPYEQLEGTVHFALNPRHPRNEVITDLKLAPGDSDGLVSGSADFSVLKPAEPQRGNHRVLLEAPNRGNRLALRFFNGAPPAADPGAPLDPGNGFLMRHGYTVVWCGWQHDVPPVKGLLGIEVPDAVGPGGPLSGRTAATFYPNARVQVQRLPDPVHRPYPTNNMNDPDATLIVRDHEDAPPQIVPRDQWSFARLEDGRLVPDAFHLYMASGFVSGKVYQVIYSTTGAPVVGLGLPAMRDFMSFLRYGPAQLGNPCADDVQHTYAFGMSQSGIFLRQLLYLGLNQDEEDRVVFDGLISHVAGARLGEFNQRFGQPSSFPKHSVGSTFPFTDMQQTDPETGRAGGLLSRLAAEGQVPKVFFTNSSAEYWGRGWASLIHTDVVGERDSVPSESVRIYHFAGTQHGPGPFPPTDTNAVDGSRAQQLFSCLDYTPLLRSALVRIDRWVTSGEPPPASRHPRIDEGTAVPPDVVAKTFKAIPGVEFPPHPPSLPRLDFGPEAESGLATTLPPVAGKAYGLLVPAVDEDGNELGSIRMPDVSVPLATYTGWNLRHPDMGSPDQLMNLAGSTIPFSATEVERKARGDPRPSIEERYVSKEDYLGRVRHAAQTLIDEGYLLHEDLERVVEQASQRYDLFRKVVGEPSVAGD